MDIREKARELKDQIPALALALKHPATPAKAKVFAALAVGYALSPIDLIPDFIPVLGQLDDLILLPVLVALSIRSIPTEVMEACREEVCRSGDGKPGKRWVYAIPVAAVWCLIVWAAAALLWK